MAILRSDKDKEKTKRPRVLLVPPPDLPVPAVQGGAVETLLTHLIRENERQGKLELFPGRDFGPSHLCQLLQSGLLPRHSHRSLPA